MSTKDRKVDLAEGVAVEYVRPSGVLRVHRPEGTLEVPLSDLLTQLGVEPAEVFPVRRYLLFGGRDDRRSGGMGDLVGLYDDEAEARAAFQRARLAIGGGLGWAHLVVMEPSGRLDRLCWFGREPGDAPRPTVPSPPAPAPSSAASRRSWSKRAKHEAETPAAPPPPPPASRGAKQPPDDDRPILAAFGEAPASGPGRAPGRAGLVPPFRAGRRRRW